MCIDQTLGSDLNSVDRQREFLARYSCAGGRSSSPSVDLDPVSFTRTGGIPAVTGVQAAGGLIGGFQSTAPDVDLGGTEPEDKPGGDGGRRSIGGSALAVGRSPCSSKSAGGASSSGALTGNSSAMYETGPGSVDVKHQHLDYGGGGGGGALLSSDPLHYYPHLGAVASSGGFSPYQPPRHHPRHHPAGAHPGAAAAHHLGPAAAYQPYAMPPELDYTSTSAFFHSNVFKAAAAASQIRTKSHSSSGQLLSSTHRQYLLGLAVPNRV